MVPAVYIGLDKASRMLMSLCRQCPVVAGSGVRYHSHSQTQTLGGDKPEYV